MSEDQTHRAVDTLRIAAQMFNDNSAMDSEAEGKQHVTQALSFQPVEVRRGRERGAGLLGCVWRVWV